MSVAPEDFKLALRQWTSGISIVTAENDGEHHGMTVSAFGSVSLAPPLISVCLAADARVVELVTASRRFAVSVLASHQAEISDRFATYPDEGRFEGQGFVEGADGCRLIEGALAHIECNVYSAHEAGDHVVLIGRVQHCSAAEGVPLLYFGGGYGVFQPQP